MNPVDNPTDVPFLMLSMVLLPWCPPFILPLLSALNDSSLSQSRVKPRSFDDLFLLLEYTANWRARRTRLVSTTNVTYCASWIWHDCRLIGGLMVSDV